MPSVHWRKMPSPLLVVFVWWGCGPLSDGRSFAHRLNFRALASLPPPSNRRTAERLEQALGSMPPPLNSGTSGRLENELSLSSSQWNALGARGGGIVDGIHYSPLQYAVQALGFNPKSA